MALNRRVLKIFRTSAWSRAWRSLAAFLLGLLLAFVYGATALYIQNQALWYCIITTVTIAAFTAFGMGLSLNVRANIMLMLPMLCSREGKKILLFLIITLVVQGPLNNTVKNLDRAATSILCGAELAMNQTQQLMQRASTPLLPVLDKVREVSRNAYSLAGRVQNLIGALTESVRHISRSLINVLHFLASIGDICNVKMGTPYQKCNSVFDEGRTDCMELLSVFNFLCHIVDGFRPLCGLTRAIIAAFNQMKKEFEFNMSASVHFEMNINSSQTVHQMIQKIIEEVSEDCDRVLYIMGLFSYVGLVLMLFMYIQAVLYKKHYLHVDDFDNCYITEKFVEMDQKLYREGKPAVLPLSKKEALTYSTPYHMVFWAFDILHHHAQEEIVAKAPLVMDIQVNGSGYASDIFKDIMASFDILQKGNITIVSKKCMMEPSEPEYMVNLFIGLLYGLAISIVLAGSYLKQLQRFVCAHYYPQREKVRILHLRSRILSQRSSVGKALLQVVTKEKDKQGKVSVLQTLALRLPGGVTIAKFLKLFDKSCLFCGTVVDAENSIAVYICSTQNCSGCFCMGCFREMGNICAVCMGPLTFQEDSEYELGSMRMWWGCLGVELLLQFFMACGFVEFPYTDLELAINTIVTQFHAASPNDGPTLTVEEFQGMLSKELPTV
ncbi:DC-STAMP domain-containing protein 2, partial [Clarias magur]